MQDGVITQSVIQSFLKTPVCGASLSYSAYSPCIHAAYFPDYCFWKTYK